MSEAFDGGGCPTNKRKTSTHKVQKWIFSPGSTARRRENTKAPDAPCCRVLGATRYLRRADLEASIAPLTPLTVGGVSQTSAPNTLYAHVWNTGKASAYRARVEFYRFDPSLGISRSGSNLLGAVYSYLGKPILHLANWTVMNRPHGSFLSKECHVIVKCPEKWIPAGGQEGRIQGHGCSGSRFEHPRDYRSGARRNLAFGRGVACSGRRSIASARPSTKSTTALWRRNHALCGGHWFAISLG